jgi:hypothetical protein
MDCIVEKIDKITQEIESLIENVHREDLDTTEKGTKAYEIFQLNGIDMGSKELANRIHHIEDFEGGRVSGLKPEEEHIKKICKKINKRAGQIRIWLESISISQEIRKAEIKKPNDEKLAGRTLARLSTIEDEELQKKVHAKIEEQEMGQMEASKLITKIKQVDEKTRDTMLKKGIKINIADKEMPTAKIEITKEDIDKMEEAITEYFEDKQARLKDPDAQKTKQLFENWRMHNSLKSLVNSGLLLSPYTGKPALKELVWKSNPNKTIMDGIQQAKKNYEDHIKKLKKGGN